MSRSRVLTPALKRADRLDALISTTTLFPGAILVIVGQVLVGVVLCLVSVAFSCRIGWRHMRGTS